MGTVSSSSPCITSSGRGANRLAASSGRNRRSSRAHSSNWTRERRVADGADLAGVLEEPPGLAGPVVEVGPGAEHGARRARAGRRRPTQMAERPAGVELPTSQMPGRLGHLLEVVDGGAQVVDPARQREVALARRRSRGR